MNSRQHAFDIFNAAVDAVHPAQLLPHYLYADEQVIRIGKTQRKRKDIERLIVVAVGKAAGAMALQAERLLGNAITYGICISKHHHAVPLSQILIHEAGHPLPDEDSVEAARLLTQMTEGCSANDVIILLLSGGASSLIADMPGGITLQDYRQLQQALINSGATIQEINAVRKQVATLKGGKFLQHVFPAHVVTLAISDVVDDDIHAIGSGLTVPENADATQAINILQQYRLENKIPSAIINWLQEQNTLKNAPASKSEYYLVANNETALLAAKNTATQLGYNSSVFKKQLTGDTEKTARMLVQQLIDYRGIKPACFLLGGETTLQVTQDGKGGRSQHFVLAAMDELLKYGNTDASMVIFAAGTDGTDGPTDAAGAICDEAVIQQYLQSNFTTRHSLNLFDSYRFFEKLSALFIPGATQTNAGDLIVVLVK